MSQSGVVEPFIIFNLDPIQYDAFVSGLFNRAMIARNDVIFVAISLLLGCGLSMSCRSNGQQVRDIREEIRLLVSRIDSAAPNEFSTIIEEIYTFFERDRVSVVHGSSIVIRTGHVISGKKRLNITRWRIAPRRMPRGQEPLEGTAFETKSTAKRVFWLSDDEIHEGMPPDDALWDAVVIIASCDNVIAFDFRTMIVKDMAIESKSLAK
jgi:hypothetical protein